MSHESTALTAAHYRYLAERTTGEDDFLRDLKRSAEAAGLPAIWIAPEQASFMQILLRLAGAREVVEVGTLAGYSAICMARTGARVRTVEVSPQHAEFAREWVGRSDVSDRVEVFLGDGREVLPTLAAGSADAAFIDADKAGYPFYLRECLRIVRPGGLIMADNAFAFGQVLDQAVENDSVEAIRAFNDVMAKTDELQSIIVPLGDGCWVGVKSAQG